LATDNLVTRGREIVSKNRETLARYAQGEMMIQSRRADGSWEDVTAKTKADLEAITTSLEAAITAYEARRNA
jgi:hypothetical protein